MTKILYYDCFSGISGDMNLAAMIGLGVDPDYLRSQLSRLGLDNEFSIELSRDARNGIHGTRVDVALTRPRGHRHDHHGAQDHEYRLLADIEQIIAQSSLAPEVCETALAMFRRVAEAEAKVRGKCMYEVHFHEVGATDSLVDLVGAAICRHALDIDGVWCSPVELGGGFVNCVHGRRPVPAPATLEILSGCPYTQGAVNVETATPTGAAILATLVDRWETQPAMRMTRTAYGIGHRVTEIPNVLRVHLAEVETPAITPGEKGRLLQCNIDDMTGVALGVAMDELVEAGAAEVHCTPIVMKKTRPAVTLSLLCAAQEEERFRQLLFRHTSTLGIKSIAVDKTDLNLTFDRMDTALGPVTMQHSWLGSTILHSKPDPEECRALARQHGISLAEVSLAVARAQRS